jgi:hypothetical protein
MSTTYTDVKLEDWVKGPFQLFDSEAARSAKAAVEAHFEAEWNSDIEATMATIHPDDPWQRIPGLGVEVVGFEAVRAYYENRFESWPGPAMDHYSRVTVTDTCVYFEGMLEIKPSGSFGGRQVGGKPIEVAAIIVVDCRDGLVLGETVHLDSAAALAQIGGREDA